MLLFGVYAGVMFFYVGSRSQRVEPPFNTLLNDGYPGLTVPSIIHSHNSCLIQTHDNLEPKCSNEPWFPCNMHMEHFLGRVNGNVGKAGQTKMHAVHQFSLDIKNQLQ